LRVQATNWASRVEVTTDGTGVVGHAGAALLGELADRVGLTTALGWRGPGARRRHPDAAVLGDLAVLLADGGDCLSDLAVLRDQPELFGPVASTPTAWRVIERVGADPDGLARLRAARAHARAWPPAPTPTRSCWWWTRTRPWCWPTATPRKRRRAPPRDRSGSARCWPTWTEVRRPASRWPACCDQATPPPAPPRTCSPWSSWRWRSCQRPPPASRSWSALIAPGASTRLAWHLRQRGVGFSLGLPVDAHVREAILAQPEPAWTPAVDPDGQVRPGAEVGELTGWIDLHTWPEGTRAICRRQAAHPGAQLRFTHHDGHHFQVFLTDQPNPDLAALELRHRQRARVEDRIRAAKATGLGNLPFDRWRRNAVWLELVLCAQDLLCWTQALPLEGHLAVAEPKALRHRLLRVAARSVGIDPGGRPHLTDTAISRLHNPSSTLMKSRG
jgi:Transposase DDE domain group 1